MKHIIYFIVFLLLLAFVNARLIADVDIPSNSLTVKPGNSTYANLRLFRVDDDGRTDYFLRAYAIDDYGNKVSELTKTITIDNELETIIELYIPSDAPLLLFAIAVFSSNNFMVISRPLFVKNTRFLFPMVSILTKPFFLR